MLSANDQLLLCVHLTYRPLFMAGIKSIYDHLSRAGFSGVLCDSNLQAKIFLYSLQKVFINKYC